MSEQYRDIRLRTYQRGVSNMPIDSSGIEY